MVDSTVPQGVDAITLAPEKVLYVTFRNSGPPPTYSGFSSWYDPIVNWKGLISKTWVSQDNGKVIGGVYYFDNADSAEEYRQWLVEGLSKAPMFSDVQTSLLDILQEPSKLTRSAHLKNAK
jgi:hypothetical protein